VNNFAGTESYTLTVTYEGPPPYRPAQQETYTLTCENAADGRVLTTQQVLVERGEAKSLTPVPASLTSGRRPAPGRARTPSPDADDVRADRLRGHGRLHLGRRSPERPRRALRPDPARRRCGHRRRLPAVQRAQDHGERLIARFKNRKGAFTWDGRATQKGRRVSDGYYFVRYRLGSDTRRFACAAATGASRAWPTSTGARPATSVPSFKLIRPVFGGTGKRSLAITYRGGQARAGDDHGQARRAHDQALRAHDRRRAPAALHPAARAAWPAASTRSGSSRARARRPSRRRW
jgi:hypothetical protein